MGPICANGLVGTTATEKGRDYVMIAALQWGVWACSPVLFSTPFSPTREGRRVAGFA
jgi:hypothetical protein